MKRILFIGHEAELTGAPFILLHLLRWLKKHRPDFTVDMLLLRDGELRPSYEEVARVYVVPEDRRPEIVVRGTRFLRRKLRMKRTVTPPDVAPYDSDYDLVLGNTVGSLLHLEFFKSRGLRTVCWLHEMRSVIESFFPEPGRFAEVSNSVDHFIAPSKKVESVLREFGVTTPVDLVNDFSERAAANDADVQSVRSSLGIPENAFVVGSCGTVGWRKGTDLFLQIAKKLTATIDDIYFVWVGGGSRSSTVEFEDALLELKRLGLPRIFITGTQPAPETYYANMDVFALTSREDPFPLVCLEAASLGKPVICFADAGGMPEFVGEDAGGIVPFGDTDTFAERILEFYNDRGKLSAAGNAAHRKVTNEFSLDSSCRKISDVILKISR